MYLGIEIGGTKLQLGVGGDPPGTLAAVERRQVDPRRGAAGILDQIQAAARSLAAQYPVERIGIGFGGPVDTTRGRAIKSHQVSGWDDMPLVEWCEEQIKAPAVIGNDCDLAALAEARFGAGRGRATVFYVTVGTGIGGGFVIDGQLHGAGRPAVAEIGHLRPGPAADQPQTTVESLAAGPGIAAATQQRLASADRRDREDLLARCKGDPAALDAKIVGDAAAGGNSCAGQVLDEARQVLGWAIAQTINLLAPEMVVVGGGVSLLGEDLFLGPLRHQVARYVFPPLADSYSLCSAELGELVVVHGAIALAQSQT
jgi:glucokinase